MYTEGEFDPRDRVYYSSNPSFTRGAEETAEIEGLLDPQVADALDVLQEARTGHIKFAGETTASRTLELMSGLEPHLDEGGASRLRRQSARVINYFEAKLDEQRRKQKTKDAELALNSQLTDVTIGGYYVSKIFTALGRGQNAGPHLNKLGEAYATQPNVLPRSLQALSNMNQILMDIRRDSDNKYSEADLDNAGRDGSKTKQEVIRHLSNLSFPIGTAKPTELIELLDRARFRFDPSSLDADLAPTGLNLPSPMGGKGKELRSSIKPANLETAIICAQFINSMSRIRTPGQATEFVNRIYETALEHGFDDGAAHLLELFSVTLLQNWPRHLASTLESFGVSLPAERFEPKNYFRFASLLIDDRMPHILNDQPFAQNDAFFSAPDINFAIMGRIGFDMTSLSSLPSRVNDRYGINIRSAEITRKVIEVGQAEESILLNWQEQVIKGNLSWSIWHHKAQEMRYDKHRQAEAEDMVLTPVEAFSRKTFETQDWDISVSERLKKDYREPHTDRVLSHRGYFNTIAQMLPFSIDAEAYSTLRTEISDMKTDIFVNGDYFISPKGDRFIVDDKKLQAAGLRHITYRKQPGNQRFTEVEIQFNNATIGCVISPDMEIFTSDGKPMRLQEGVAEPLEYLIFGYLHALRCQPERISEKKAREIERSSGDCFTRRAHMRRLIPGAHPHQRQIDLALEREDFDIVEDNKWRTRHNLPVRTYVEQTVVQNANMEPNILRAKYVVQHLKDVE